MHRKLYFMLPDVAYCKKLITELRNVGIKEREIHVIARDDCPLEGLPQASVLEKTELKHGIELGISIGGIAGMLGGVLAVTFPPAGFTFGGGAIILITTLAGASFASIVSALVARDIPNHELAAFQTGILQGQILLILDVSSNKVNEIMRLINDAHPETTINIVKPA